MCVRVRLRVAVSREFSVLAREIDFLLARDRLFSSANDFLVS